MGMEPAVERTAVEVLHMLAFPHQSEEGSFDSQAAGRGEQTSRDTLVAALTRDLNGPHRAQALQGLCDMLVGGTKRRVDFSQGATECCGYCCCMYIIYTYFV